MEQHLKKLQEILEADYEIDPEKVTMEASFIDDLGLDSLDTVELVMALEEEYEIGIPDEDPEGWTTVGDVVRYLENLP